MSVRKISFESATLDEKIVSEDADSIVFPAVIAREMVQPYAEGMAYKSAEELEKACDVASKAFNGYLPIIYGMHPDSSNGYQGLLIRSEDVKGRTENLRFVKDLLDPKTKRPMDRGIKADIRFYKKDLSLEQLNDLKTGARRDVSIGFVYDEDRTPGEWRGQKYDFKQNSMFLQHVAAGVPAGRCTSPYCGLGLDELGKTAKKVGLDPYKSISELPDAVKVLPEEAQKMFMAVVNSALEQYNGDESKAFATAWAAIERKWKKNDKGEWIKKGADELSVRTCDEDDIFCVVDGKKADKWAAICDSDLGKMVEAKSAVDCPICKELDRLGRLEFSSRLMSKVGRDIVLEALSDNPKKTESKILAMDEVERAKKLIKTLQKP